MTLVFARAWRALTDANPPERRAEAFARNEGRWTAEVENGRRHVGG